MTNELIGTLENAELEINVTIAESGPKGDKGDTPYVENGYWYINGTSTGIKAQGTDGTNGTDGADGKDGATPEIINGTWWINGIDTGVQADVAPIREEFETLRTQTDSKIGEMVTKTTYNDNIEQIESYLADYAKEPTNFEVVMNEGYSSSLTNNYIKKNGWVFLTLQATRGGTSFEKDIVHNIAEIPVGFRPINNTQFSAKAINTGLRCNANLNTSGILGVQIMSSEVSGITNGIFICLAYYAGGGTV